jgi:predicted lipoprotein with Yx(FWY)xxD motif
MKMKQLISLSLTFAIAAVVVVALASGGSAKNRVAQAAGGTAISVRHTSVGATLVDANGRTLYLFEADKHNVSRLSAAGRAVWPLFTSSGTVTARGGAQVGKIGRTAAHQLTYNGHPLYYFVGDHGAGSIRGQHLNEFGALWFVLSPGGNAITTAVHSTNAPSTPSAGYATPAPAAPATPAPTAPTYSYSY